MKRRLFFATAAAAAVTASCARMEKREKRYDEKECPFCSTKPGQCSYCGGNKKCTFCQGTGKRKTVAPTIPEENIKKGSYIEDCPYCKNSGVCRYCKGSGKCWACDGTGRIESWDFYDKYQQLVKGAPAPAAQPMPEAPDTAKAAGAGK